MLQPLEKLHNNVWICRAHVEHYHMQREPLLSLSLSSIFLSFSLHTHTVHQIKCVGYYSKSVHHVHTLFYCRKFVFLRVCLSTSHISCVGHLLLCVLSVCSVYQHPLVSLYLSPTHHNPTILFCSVVKGEFRRKSNSLIIYQPLCCFKPLWLSKGTFWTNLLNSILYL